MVADTAFVYIDSCLQTARLTATSIYEGTMSDHENNRVTTLTCGDGNGREV
jgi:hypothetical protein